MARQCCSFLVGWLQLLSWRVLVANLISQALANGSFARKKIIVISERGLIVSSRSLGELGRYGYHPVKIWDVSREEITSLGITGSLRSKLTDVIEVARNERVEDIILS